MLLGIPFALAAIIVLSTLTTFDTANWQVEIILIVTIVVFGWPSIARVLRSTVLVTRNADYVVAGQALGLSGSRVLFRHILPNAVSPILVLSTMRVGGYIATEASLSYLGLGLHPPAVSWGQMVSDGQPYLAHRLLRPAVPEHLPGHHHPGFRARRRGVAGSPRPGQPEVVECAAIPNRARRTVGAGRRGQ